MTKATELNNEEVRLSELAAQQAANPEVKNFAQQLLAEHTQSGSELNTIANRKGVTPVARDEYDQRTTAKLGKKAGKEFDEAYVEKIADANEDAVDLYEKAARSSKDPDIQAFASKQLPALKQHEEHAKTLEKAVK